IAGGGILSNSGLNYQQFSIYIAPSENQFPGLYQSAWSSSNKSLGKQFSPPLTPPSGAGNFSNGHFSGHSPRKMPHWNAPLPAGIDRGDGVNRTLPDRAFNQPQPTVLPVKLRIAV